MMDWQQQREQWNRDYECSRKACRAPLRRRDRFRAAKHRDTGLLYCLRCARMINDYNPMPDGEPLVVRLEADPFK